MKTAYDKRLYTDKHWELIGKWMTTLFIWTMLILLVLYEQPIISPLPSIYTQALERDIQFVDLQDENLHQWVAQYAEQYTTSETQYSIMVAKLHFLLAAESKHGSNDNYGDGGLAGGPMQFHQATWNRMREKMLQQGLVEEIGDREDMEQAIHTTAWAISMGREDEWGPILRGEIQL